MTDKPDTPKPETNGQRMNRLIRQAPRRTTRRQMGDSIRGTWAKTTDMENRRD
ncbi:MAG TPA: hypothetical protein VFP69_20080 [Streptomyces sp.]|nr:hypothetical protein [Streptomyces sp.]